ncbi:50S ribosomal protein L15 [Mycoplasmoides alvi]|uniref:50S ribosomal protein L15 n=1 Tax=Mycoplasmoides alvi TaxID=78580 RepID=UPI00051C52A2|nr:50S ribosomal protein L15 [Mycoplasmoides alvi]
MELHQLKSTPKSRNHRTKIVGRGHGSGLGKTSGRGQKGQKARKSGHTRPGFEGGQTPLYRRLPKFGFSTYNFKTKYVTINLENLIDKTESQYKRLNFVNCNLISNKSKQPIKIIGNVDVSKPIVVEVQKISAGAKNKIEAAGGKVVIVDLSTALKEYKNSLAK